MEARISTPPQPGTYTLLWDMAQEEPLWFSTLGAATGEVRVRVRPPQHGAPAVAPTSVAPPQGMITISRRAGSFTFDESLARCVQAGEIDRADALLRAPHPDELELLLNPSRIIGT